MGKWEGQMCCQWEEGSWWYGGFKEGHDMNPCILNYEMTKMYNTEVDCPIFWPCKEHGRIPPF